MNPPSELGLSFHSDPDEGEDPAMPTLLWSRLDKRELILTFTFLGSDPRLTLTAADRAVGFDSVDRNDATLTVKLDSADAARLADGGPIWVSLGGDYEVSMVTWPYQLATLQGRLERTTNRELLAKTGSLPEEDAELLLVLRELESTLIFDAVTAWRVANAGGVAEGSQDQSSLRWEELDWDRVRRDPRYGAYLYSGSRGAIDHTDIEVVLASISGRLAPLGEDPSDVGDDDLRALGRQPPGDAFADAGRAQLLTLVERGQDGRCLQAGTRRGDACLDGSCDEPHRTSRPRGRPRSHG